MGTRLGSQRNAFRLETLESRILMSADAGVAAELDDSLMESASDAATVVSLESAEGAAEQSAEGPAIIEWGNSLVEDETIAGVGVLENPSDAYLGLTRGDGPSVESTQDLFVGLDSTDPTGTEKVETASESGWPTSSGGELSASAFSPSKVFSAASSRFSSELVTALNAATPPPGGFGQTVYLDFDGAENVVYDGPVRIEGIDVPAFSAEAVGLGGQEASIARQTVALLEEDFGPLGIKFLDSFELDGTDQVLPRDYSTVYIGGDDQAFAKYGRFHGLAEKVDVGNVDRSDEAFVFPATLGGQVVAPGQYAWELARLVGHELDHLLGWSHPWTDPHAPSTLSALAFDQDGGHFAHQWLTYQGYLYFREQFGASELDDYLYERDENGRRVVDEEGSTSESSTELLPEAVLREFDGGHNNGFVEGAYDEDVPNESPFAEGVLSCNHPQLPAS